MRELQPLNTVAVSATLTLGCHARFERARYSCQQGRTTSAAHQLQDGSPYASQSCLSVLCKLNELVIVALHLEMLWPQRPSCIVYLNK